MSEEHDVECPMEDEKQTDESEEKVVENDEVGDKTVDENAEDCRTTVNTEEPSANTSKDDSAIDVIDKETLSSEVDEKKDVYGANERTSPSLTWTAEGNEFKISWNLPEGTATEFDYIALCCIGHHCSRSLADGHRSDHHIGRNRSHQRDPTPTEREGRRTQLSHTHI